MRDAFFARLSAIALVLLLSASFALAEGAHTRALITSPINNADRVTLYGNTHPAATAENDRGRVSDSLPMEHLQLVLKRSPEQEKALGKYITDLQTPTSPNYHRWLSAREFGDQYGLAKTDIDAISGWLQGHGFKVNVRYANGVLLDFSGTAGMVREAFQTEIHYLQVKHEMHISNMSDPKIPAALAAAVHGVASLNDFRPDKNFRKKAQFTTSGGFLIVVPGDLATIYNLNPLFTEGISGQGQTVVVIEDTNMKASDWHIFRQTFGLNQFKGGSFTQVNPASSGTNNCVNPGMNGDVEEAALDAEWASASAPSAAIELASCADTTTFGGLIAVQNLVNGANPPGVISMSYSLCEAQTPESLKAAFNSAFQQAVAEGVSVFGSSGDALASECDRPFPAAFHGIGVSGWTSTPYNVSVGGTDFSDTFLGENSTYWSSTNSPTFASALSYIPEMPWNDSCANGPISFALGFPTPYGSDGTCNSSSGQAFLDTAGAGGGPSECATGTPSIGGVVSGTCEGYPKPSWQNILGVPADGVRDTPDVSLFAANGVWGHFYVFCVSTGAPGTCSGTPDTWPGAGGTSFATPIMAGMQALVNQKAGGRQGNPNVVYYALANNEYGSAGSSDCNSTLGNAASSSCVFYDITLGDIVAPCNPQQGRDCFDPSGTIGVLSTSNSSFEPAYAATNGYDMASGIGSVNVLNLVNQWSTAAPKSVWDKR